ncbi:integrase [Rhizobium anhuiense]|uniref:Mu transposase C-terminal domain-containing protein n=1 Tax=Rhizobium anhuiense TaxID=1184720 RepID=UPI000BEA0878|nr:Mu transposase C-terminal domain-containing protein [Rhizobium anhuiense]PDS34702.1 integrase [Rhizobium anhuiense]
MLSYALPTLVYHHSIVEMDDTDRFTSGGQDYVPLRADGDGYVMRHEDDGREVFMGHAEIHRKLSEKRAAIHYGYNSVPEQKLRLIWGDETFEGLDPEKRALPSFREKLILRYEDECLKAGKALPRSEKKLQPLLDQWAEEINRGAQGERRKRGDRGSVSFGAPSVRQFNRDYADYMDCGRKTLALAHRHHGPGQRLFMGCPESMAIAHRGARRYLSRKKPTKARCYLMYSAELFEINEKRTTKLHKVSRTKFESMIDRFDEFEKDASRHGEKWAVDKYARNLRTYDILAPGQRVEIDEVNVDLMTLLVETGLYEGLPEWVRAKIPKVRIWFVAAIDVATRYVLAFRATFNPTANAAIAALRMIMTDKRLLSQSVGAKTPWIGMLRPKEVYSDNGSAFIAERTRAVFKAALVGTTCPPAGDPARRPFIESLFHSVGPMIAQFFDGRTFGSVAEKGDYNPEAFASVTTDEFVRMFTYAICDIYHNKPHASLGGNSPHNAWVRATQEHRVRQVPSDEEMLHIFGVPSKRPISDDGINYQGITYGSDELNVQRMRHGKKEFDIKTDPENVRWIAVKGDEGWFTVENTVGIDDDITLAEWIAARKEELSHNATEAEDGMAAMYEAVNRLRRAGESATIRAHLSPAIPDAEDHERMEREVMRGWKPGARRSGPLPELVSEMSPPADPLRGPPRRALRSDSPNSTSTAAEDSPPARSIPITSTLDYNEDD